MDTTPIRNILKNIVPSLFVMGVGLFGAFFVYNNYASTFSGNGIASIEPAAGIVAPADAEDELNFDNFDPFADVLPQPEAYQSIPEYKEFE